LELKLRDLVLLLRELLLHLINVIHQGALFLHIDPAVLVHLGQVIPHDVHLVQDLTVLLY
jgi:hypothetical protein